MNLSKTKYCQGVQCKKMLWLDKYKPAEKTELNNETVFENGTEVGALAKCLFGEYIDIDFNEDLEMMISDTKEALKKENVIITEASFKYNHNFCSVDILKKNQNNYEIYEVKSSTEVKDIYIDDISYQVYVLSSLGLNVTKACIVHLNSKYERVGAIYLKGLFKIEDVTDIAKMKQNEIKQNIQSINLYMEQSEEPIDDIDLKCFNPYPCPFFKYCTKSIPNNNVFNIKSMRISSKIKYYKDNKYTYEELLKAKIDDKYKQQIEFELYNKEPIINRDKINEFINTLTYPLYFLDFETFQQPIPLYEYVKPFMQIPFQYSLHYIEKEGEEVKHKEFLAESNIDPRRSLAENLVKDIPRNVCVVAYNMSFEKTVIKNLAKLYPDLQEHLLNIHDNMYDLMIPFKNRYYYTKEMYGSYSIKYVLPALFPNDAKFDYHNLDLIHNGSEASSAYANLHKLSLKEQKEIRNNLLKYCELDTLAMVKIYDKLKGNVL